MGDRNLLLEMGFPEGRVNAALLKTKNAGLQPSIDWLSEHADKPDAFFEDIMAAAGRSTGEAAEGEADGDEGDGTVGSLVCDVTGKRFRNAAQAQCHAIKTGYTEFSQSTDIIPELTQEQKVAKLAELRVKLAEKRAKQAITDKTDSKENERIRRRQGQESIEAQEAAAKKSMDKEFAARRAEKIADAEAKRKIKEQIAADKAERAALKRAREQGQTSAAPAAKEARSVAPTVNVDRHAMARIQVRFPDGISPYTNTFEATETFSAVLAAVRTYRQENGATATDSFTLNSNFPRASYATSDGQKTLKELQLVPSAGLMYKAA